MMLRLVKAPEKPRPAMSLTMGGPPPARFPKTAPGLTYAQGVLTAPNAVVAPRPDLRLIVNQG